MLTEEQQQVRAKGIGASETAALLGLDPYRGPIDIYMKKLGLVEDAESHHIDRGNYLEPALRQWASDKLSFPFREGHTRSLVDCHVFATPDGVGHSDKSASTCVWEATLELKSPGPSTWHEWTDETAPDRYVIQVCQQMAVFDVDTGYLAALVGGDLKVYRFERDRELEVEIVETIERFWRDHIEKQAPPPVDGSSGADAWLAKRFPRNERPGLLTADTRGDELIEQLKQINESEKNLAREHDLVCQQLKEIIGDASGIQSPLGRVTWKTSKDTQRTDWKALASELNPAQDIIDKHTTTKPGPRVFRSYFGR